MHGFYLWKLLQAPTPRHPIALLGKKCLWTDRPSLNLWVPASGKWSTAASGLEVSFHPKWRHSSFLFSNEVGMEREIDRPVADAGSWAGGWSFIFGLTLTYGHELLVVPEKREIMDVISWNGLLPQGEEFRHDAWGKTQDMLEGQEFPQERAGKCFVGERPSA